MRNSPKRQNILARMKENIYRNFGPAIDKFLVVEKLRQLVRLYVLLVSKRSLVTSRSLQTLKVGLQLLDVKCKRKHSSFLPLPWSMAIQFKRQINYNML